MGRTETDLPGTEKALLGVLVACAAIADTDEVLSAAAVPDAVTDGTADAGTEEKPLTITPAFTDEVEVAEAEEEETDIVADAEELDTDVVEAELAAGVVAAAELAVMEVKPLTEMALPPLEAVLEVAAPLLEVEVDEVDDNVEVEDHVVDVQDVVVDSDDDVSEEEVLPLDDPLLVESKVNLHFLTSSTAGLPFLSTIGVSVITHVSVIGPAGVMVLWTVVTVVEFAARARIGAAFTELNSTSRQENSKKKAIEYGRIMVNIASCYEEG